MALTYACHCEKRQRRGNLLTTDTCSKRLFATAKAFAALMGWTLLAMTAGFWD